MLDIGDNLAHPNDDNDMVELVPRTKAEPVSEPLRTKAEPVPESSENA